MSATICIRMSRMGYSQKSTPYYVFKTPERVSMSLEYIMKSGYDHTSKMQSHVALRQREWYRPTYVTCFAFSIVFFLLNVMIAIPNLHAVNRIWRSVRHMTYILWGRYETDPHLGDQMPQNPILMSWIGFLCIAVWNIRTCMLLPRLQTNLTL